MTRLRPYAVALLVAVFVTGVATSRRPDHIQPRNEARSWYEYGLSLAREGNVAAAIPVVEEARKCAVQGQELWVKATLLLGVLYEHEGNLDAANYYFAREQYKQSAFAGRLRSEIPGCWGRLRRLVESERDV